MNNYGEMHQQKFKEILEELFVLGQETASLEIDEMIKEIQEQLRPFLELAYESPRHGVGS